MIDIIEIKGYKSIKNVRIHLSPINILIGGNGVGKSNLISFFKFLNTVYERRLENYSFIHGADNILYFGRKTSSALEAYVQFENKNAYAFILAPTTSNKLIVQTESTFFNKQMYGTGSWKKDVININSKEAVIIERNNAISKYVKNYLKSFKVYHFHDTSENAPLRSDSNINDNILLKENGSNIAAYLYYLQQEHPTSFRRIEKIIQSVAPFFERFELHPQRLNEQNIKLEWLEVNHPEKYFNASHLSDGTLRFMAFATLLLQPELPKTIMIDEPELGLHPVAINKLSGLIQSAADRGCQIIISTQSINLVNNFSPEDIITVDRVNEQSSFNRLNSEELSQWLDGYSIGDLWSKNIIKGQP